MQCRFKEPFQAALEFFNERLDGSKLGSPKKLWSRHSRCGFQILVMVKTDCQMYNQGLLGLQSSCVVVKRRFMLVQLCVATVKLPNCLRPV